MAPHRGRASNHDHRPNPLAKLDVRSGFVVTGTHGGGVTILAKPNEMTAMIMRYAVRHPAFPAAEFIPWSPRMLPRIQWQLDAGDVRGLLGWLKRQNIPKQGRLPTKTMRDTAQRIYLAIVTAQSEGHGLGGCVC